MPHSGHTTTMTTSGHIPTITLGWRMRLALGDIPVGKMADDLGYSRSTLSRWLNDQDEPRPAILAQWALMTGVDHTWLKTGEQSGDHGPDGGPVRSTRGNAQLAHLRFAA